MTNKVWNLTWITYNMEYSKKQVPAIDNEIETPMIFVKINLFL